MENLVSGIITVFLCVLGYYLAFKFFKNKKITVSLFLIIICGLLLRVYVGTDRYLHQWDERYHVLVAKNLIAHPLKPTLYEDPVLPYDYKNWTANHIWLHKQPLPLWAMALSMRVFSVNEITTRLPSIFISTIAIYLTFAIGCHFFNRRVALLAAFFHSIHGLIIELTGGRVATDHIDIFFLFFIELAIYFTIIFIQKGKTYLNLIAGVSIGFAILTKWLPALIVLPIWIFLVIDSRKFCHKEIIKNFLILIATCFIVFLPWQIYIYIRFPLEAHWESAFNMMHITQILDQHSGPFYYHFLRLTRLYGELIFIPLIWFIYKSIKRPKRLKYIALSSWFMIPILFFSFVETKMQAYTIFASPSIFIVTALFWIYLYRLRDTLRFKWLSYVLLCLLIALPIRTSLERVKPFHQRERNPYWARELKNLKKNISSQNAIIFNIDRPIEAMFYSGLTVYAIIPEKKQIQNLIRKGYKVFIYNSDSIPESVKNLKDVEIIN